MKRLLRRLSRRLQAAFERSLDAEAPKFSAEGVAVVDRYSPDEQSNRVLQEMRRALWFIHEADPITWRRLVKYVDRITIMPLRARGYFVRERREIILQGSLVAAGNPSDVALTLVHELAHARVAAANIYSVTREQRTREEVLCERRVRAFISRVAQSDPAWADYRDQRLAQPLPTALPIHDLRDLRRADTVEGLKHLGAPAWLVRVFERLTDFRRQYAGSSSDR